jgi:hypothetical protein
MPESDSIEPMTREELEGRSASELIDLILQQQTQIEQLQTQVAELQRQVAQLQLSIRDGESAPLLAASVEAEPDVATRRRTLGLRALVLMVVIFAAIVTLIVTTARPATFVRAGRVEDFRLGSVTLLQLPVVNKADPPVPVFLARDPIAGVLAFHTRDPYSRCPVEWKEAEQRFEDSCLGSRYTRSGEYISGPATRGLDLFPMIVTQDGEIRVDVNGIVAGPIPSSTSHP